ncbi:hypothetical protein MP638_006821 [Amoeboaphelidium occidentale]|nr:hypothetical protein MP638_006821 [Amoeboaphelidium occidentale]
MTKKRKQKDNSLDTEDHDKRTLRLHTAKQRKTEAGKVNVVDKALEPGTINEESKQQQVQPELEQHETAPVSIWNSLYEWWLHFTTPVPKKLWLKYESDKVTTVPTFGCKDVDDFKKAIISEIKLKESAGAFDVFIDVSGTPARPGHFLKDSFYDSQSKSWFGISDENPLIAKAIPREGIQATKLTFTWNTTDIQPLKYEPQNPLFELDTNYLAGAGLPVSNKLVLYCRPQFHKQFEFLQKTVCEDAALGYILGPPGTGKSTTTLAFASTLNRDE